MTVSTGEANLVIARNLVASMAASGLRHVVICPGSRSTPLAVAFASSTQVKSWVLIDERSAAYFALGMARQLAAPVAILCTSGTAAANFLPAVVEASLSRIPLIVLTADRPPELRGWGAAQTIDQIALYGSHVKWFADLPVPDGDPALAGSARAAAARAMQTAAAAPAGPVHLNLPFREPLLPADMSNWQPAIPIPAANSSAGADLEPTCTSVSERAIAALAAEIRAEAQGVIVAGPCESRESPRFLAAFAALTCYPVLADPLSGARFGPDRPPTIIDAYDSFLRHPETAAALAPEVVIRLGAIPTSKPLQQFLAAHPGKQHILIDPGSPRDPLHLATAHLPATVSPALRELSQHLRRAQARQSDNAWLAHWQNANEIATGAIAASLAAESGLSEGRTLAEVATALPNDATLVVGNSMPVRDADTFMRGDERHITIVANRGANGIDGVVSSALGAAAVSSQPVALVVGDLSYYHDMNGLLAAQLLGLNATIVVLNNNGGGIFSFLPQADSLDNQTFERLFGTPIGLNIERTAELYGATYARPATWRAFRASLCRALQSSGLSIVEVVTDRTCNVRQHRAVAARVAEALRQARDHWV